LTLRVHPSHVVSEDAALAWQLFKAYFAGGFSPGTLPFAGGYAEQPACVIATFDILADAESRLTRKPSKPGV
jgi:hypothetical protein